MSKILLLALFLFIGCEAVEEKAGDTVGNVRRFDPIELRDSDFKKVHGICMALAAKEDVLNILISNAAEYSFQYAQKNCDDSKMPALKNILTTIQGFDPYYTFQAQNGLHFGFPNVETTTNGIMAEICENVFRDGKIESPMSTRSGAIWFTTVTASEHCKSDSKGSCIHIQRGTLKSGYDYKIHTNEWMKVSLSGSRRGFFTERKLISSASCDGKKTFEKRAILR